MKPQDTFVTVWNQSCRWRAEGPLAAWIWGIGIRRLIDAIRRSSSRSRVTFPLADVEVSAEDRVLLGIEHGDLAGALDRLARSCARSSRPWSSTA